MRIKDALMVPCRLFIECGDRTFDTLEVDYSADSRQNISRKMALEIEQSPTRTIEFHTPRGILPVQGPFICIPNDFSQSINQSFVYETKIYPRTMDLEIFYENPAGPNLHIKGKYRDSIAQTRLRQAIDRNSIMPVFFIQKAVIPLKNGAFEWTPELKDNILVLRLWSNKMIRSSESPEESDLTSR